MKNRCKNNNSGFTLVELIIVLAILGIISAIAVPKFTNVKKEAEKKATEESARVLMNATRLAMVNGDLEEDEKLNSSNLTEATLLEYSKDHDLESILVPEYIDKIPDLYNSSADDTQDNDDNDGDNTGDDSTDENNIKEWKSHASYKIDDIVTYKGSTYKCRQSYTDYGDPNWAPDIAKSLWEKIK